MKAYKDNAEQEYEEQKSGKGSMPNSPQKKGMPDETKNS